MELTAEQVNDIHQAAEKLNEIFEKIKKIFTELIKRIVDVLTPYLQKVIGWIEKGWKEILKAHAKAAGLERCFYLAYHARKARTRKKNLKRLVESMEVEE